MKDSDRYFQESVKSYRKIEYELTPSGVAYKEPLGTWIKALEDEKRRQ